MELPIGDKVDYSPALSAVRFARMAKTAKIRAQEPRPTIDKHDWPPNYDAVYEWRRKKLAQIESGEVDVERMRAFYANGVEGCLRFISHWMDVYEPRNAGTNKPIWMPMILFPAQVNLVRFVFACLNEEEAGLVEKSRTMGASWVCINVSIWMWLFWHGAAIGWGSQSQDQVDQIGNMSTLFEKMRQAIARVPVPFKPRNLLPSQHLLSRRLVNPDNGATIIGEIGDKIGRGGRTRIYFMDEAAHYERPEVIEASVSETTRVKIYVSSVHGMGNLFHRKREAGIDWHPGAKLPKGATRVFVMDWSDHPEYDQEWFDTKKKAAHNEGIGHIFAQEIERNYAASIEGVILNADHINAAVDAHIVLGIEPSGGIVGALDVADGGNDRNAWAGRQDFLLHNIDQWGERDTARTTRRAVKNAEELMQLTGMDKCDIEYDCVGLGSGVKGESNRLKDDGLLPSSIQFIPWNAAGAVLNGGEPHIRNDPKSPRAKDILENLKAQGWWHLARRFEITYRAVMFANGTPCEGDEKGVHWQPGDIISLSSKIPLLPRLKKELSQPVWTKSTRLKLMVDKTPEGTTSPNLADAVMMAYWPVPATNGILSTIFAGPIIITP